MKELGHSGIMIYPLTPLQSEASKILAEECVELAKECSKIERCGLPFIATGEALTFKEKFTEEIADVLTLIDEAIAAGLVDRQRLVQVLDNKPARLRKWTTHLGYAPVRYANPLLLNFNSSDDTSDRD